MDLKLYRLPHIEAQTHQHVQLHPRPVSSPLFMSLMPWRMNNRWLFGDQKDLEISTDNKRGPSGAGSRQP